MRYVHAIRLWFRATFMRRRVEHDLAREMESHIAMEREKLEREGVAPREAERRARVAFGGVQRFTEDVIDERGTRALDSLGQDVRYAFRQWRAAPVLTATMIAMLALGIGVNSFLLAMIERDVVQAPPGVAGDRSLVRIRNVVDNAGDGRSWRGLSHPELEQHRAQRDLFESVGGWAQGDMLISVPGGDGDVSTRWGEFVTSEFFSTIRVQPVLGTMPSGFADDGSDGYDGVVVSHRFWRQHLAASPNAVGRVILIGRMRARVVAVAPPGFDGLGRQFGVPASVWLPIGTYDAATGRRPIDLTERASGVVSAVARLRRGVPADQATLRAAAIAEQFRPERVREGVRLRTDVVRLRANNLAPGVDSQTRTMLAANAAVALLILAIVSTNVGTLILGRAAARQREVAVRLTLGASRMRLLRQLLTESAVLAGAGALGGLALLALSFSIFRRYFPSDVLTFGWWTIGATIPAALVAAVLFGLSPALHATQTSVSDALKRAGSGGKSRATLQRRLVIAHVALSQPMLVGIALLASSVLRPAETRGAERIAERTVVATLGLQPHGRRDSAATVIPPLRESLAALPGVEQVAEAVFWTGRDKFDLPVAERGSAPLGDDAFPAHIEPVGEGYFDLLNVRLLAGRAFDRTDIPGAPMAAIIASDVARDVWGASNPVGRTLRRYRGTATYTIVGVVDAADAGPSYKERGMRVFVATGQMPGVVPSLLLRTRGGADALVPAVRDRIRTMLPGRPIAAVETLSRMNAVKRRERLITGAVAGGIGLLALLMASIGLYAVVAYAVAQRTREIGIRVALGAGHTRIASHFARDGVKLCLIGSAIGLPASVIAVQALVTGFNVRGFPAVGIGTSIAAVVTAVALVATWLPARRAARVDPVAACRAE